MLLIAVLLLGVIFTHGMNTAGIQGHPSTSAAVALTDQTDGQHDDQGPAHSADQCASGQPQYGSAGTSVCFAVSVREPVTPARSSLRPSLTDVDFRGAWAVAMRSSTIQQV
jgi:hypothetical protein